MARIKFHTKEMAALDTIIIMIIWIILITMMMMVQEELARIEFYTKVYTGLYLGRDGGQNRAMHIINASCAKCVQKFCAICTAMCSKVFVTQRNFVICAKVFKVAGPGLLQAMQRCWSVWLGTAKNWTKMLLHFLKLHNNELH